MTTACSGFFVWRSRIRATNTSRETGDGGAAPARKVSDRSLLTVISSGEIGVVSLLPTLGSCTSPGVISGAVTMKITSSTSITSIYGTTLIWLIDLRGRRMSGLVQRKSSLSLQDVRELFDECLESRGQTIDVVGVAVIGDDGRDRRGQADGGRNQRLRDSRRHLRQRRVTNMGKASKGVHDAPHGAEQPDVGAHRADGRQSGEVGLERIDLALVGRTHRAPRAVHRRRPRGPLLAVLGEFAKARREDALQGRIFATLSRTLEQGVQIAAFPEFILEGVSLRRRAFEREHLEKDLPP